MTTYNKIVNPKTGRAVNINSNLGKKIIHNYLIQLGGLNIPQNNKCWKVKSGWNACTLDKIQQSQKIALSLTLSNLHNLVEFKEYMYTVDCQSGKVTIVDDDAELNHHCLNNNNPISAAGIIIRKGDKITLDNCSGHFLPDTNALNNIDRILVQKNLVEPNILKTNPADMCGDDDTPLETQENTYTLKPLQ